MHSREESRHLLYGIRHEHRLEIVAKLQSAAYTGSNGIDILQYRRIFNTDDVAAGLGLDKLAIEHVAESLSLVAIGAAYSEVGETFERNFLSMRRSTDTCEIVVGHVIHLMEIFRAHKILVGHDALDGSDDKLVANPRLEFLEMVLQVGRGSHEH